MKQPNNQKVGLIWLTPNEAKHRFTEWSADPMALTVAAAMLLVPEFQEIVQRIRQKYELKFVPVELKERAKFLKQKLKTKDERKIWKDVYKSVGEVTEIKDVAELAVKIGELMPLFEKYIKPQKRKGRPPTKQWLPWPQADACNVVAAWATGRRVWPVPEYFYNPKLPVNSGGAAITYIALSKLNEQVINRTAETSSLEPRSKKRNRETLDRDAYFYLLRHDGAGMTATDVASYLIEEGSLEEYPVFESEEQEYQFRKKLSWKVAKACNRFEEYVSALVGQNS